jgi:hypothetical protein
MLTFVVRAKVSKTIGVATKEISRVFAELK